MMMGNGMMGPGMTMGPHNGFGDDDGSRHDGMRIYLERWVTMTRNPRLKGGPITEKDSNTITADIVTAEKDALVQRFNVDRRSGFWQPVP